VNSQVRLILAHGYAVYSGELKCRAPEHKAVLLAPKAIGPKLLQYFHDHFPNPHSLVAAYSVSENESESFRQITQGLGFAPHALVKATFEQETVGDLISEQGLLCGGIFNLMDWTMEAMTQAGVPEALIQEECLTELELIVSMIRERGVGSTFKSISQAAQCGTIAVRQELENLGYPKAFQELAKAVENKEFAKRYQSADWKNSAQELTEKLSVWENKLQRKTKARS
jgi:ketol-acid reductoisomerase